MNIQEFTAKYVAFKAVDKIVIACEHPDHAGKREKELGKQPAQRNVTKNGAFICRDCQMAFDNPGKKAGTVPKPLDLVTVVCTHPEHKGPRETQMQWNCYQGGSKKPPYERICKSCVQLGKIIPEEQRAKISATLTGRTLSPRHRRRILAWRKNNPAWAEKANRNLIPGLSSGWNRGLETPEEVRQKISVSNTGKVRTKRQRRNISVGRKKMLAAQGGFTPEHRRKLRDAALRQYARGYDPNNHSIGGFHESPKAGRIQFRSSYEARAYEKLDANPQVKTYRFEKVKIPFFKPDEDQVESVYLVDIVVEYVDGLVEWVEIKPAKMLNKPINLAKFAAARLSAEEAGVRFAIWSEPELWGAVYRESLVRDYAKKLKARIAEAKS